MATYKEFSMSGPDFIGGLMGYWGARLDSVGAWRLPNGLLVGLHPSPFNPEVQPGWHRWQLPGIGGATLGRLVDRTAPFVVCSPDERLFWCGTRGGYMARVGYWQLLNQVAEHAIESGARCGWPEAGIGFAERRTA